jgi:hypothetical protein
MIDAEVDAGIHAAVLDEPTAKSANGLLSPETSRIPQSSRS